MSSAMNRKGSLQQATNMFVDGKNAQVSPLYGGNFIVPVYRIAALPGGPDVITTIPSKFSELVGYAPPPVSNGHARSFASEPGVALLK